MKGNLSPELRKIVETYAKYYFTPKGYSALLNGDFDWFSTPKFQEKPGFTVRKTEKGLEWDIDPKIEAEIVKAHIAAEEKNKVKCKIICGAKEYIPGTVPNRYWLESNLSGMKRGGSMSALDSILHREGIPVGSVQEVKEAIRDNYSYLTQPFSGFTERIRKQVEELQDGNILDDLKYDTEGRRLSESRFNLQFLYWTMDTDRTNPAVRIADYVCCQKLDLNEGISAKQSSELAETLKQHHSLFGALVVKHLGANYAAPYRLRDHTVNKNLERVSALELELMGRVFEAGTSLGADMPYEAFNMHRDRLKKIIGATPGVQVNSAGGQMYGFQIIEKVEKLK